MEQFTYSALKKPAVRLLMLDEKVARLGTQSGQYGVFQEQARILTLDGANEIRDELKRLASEIGHDVSAIFDLTPTLKNLIK